jgi:hypothetical protein
MRLMMRVAMAAWLLSGVAYAQDCSATPPKVCAFKKAFEPDPNAGSDAAGSPVCDDYPDGDDKDKVLAAYDLAPQKIKAELCKAEIYIFDSNKQNNSWGRWENPDYHSPSGKTQIAINSKDLSTTFSEKQDAIFADLGMGNIGQNVDEVIPRNRDPQILGLLYVLGHELGHISWHKDVYAGNVGCADDANFYSWADIADAKKQRWTTFNLDKGQHKNVNVKKPSNITKADELRAIYTGGFVTALAATNPEEDFVETYAVRTLIEVCPSCEFYVQAPKNGGTKIRINDDGGEPVLQAKFNCVYNKYIK